MSFVQAVLESLRQRPDKVICRDTDHELTAGQMLEACQAAAGFSATVAGERVGILLPHCALCPPALLGVMWAGKVPVPLNPLLKPAELDFILKEAAIDTVVVATATEPLLAGLGVKGVHAADVLRPGAVAGPPPAVAGPNDTAVLLYTSGTTGRPKGVPLTHANLLSNARGLINRFAATADDVFLAVLPLFHALGLIGTTIIPWLLGAEVTYTHFTPERVATLAAQRRATVFLGVPSMYRLLARGKVAASSLQGLRLPVCGGDALPSGVRDGYRQRFGHDLLEGYGLTETSAVISANSPGSNKPGSVGRPLPGVQVRIRGDDGTARETGAEGEIQVRGPNVMPGYHNRPEENQAAFTADGWFRTGDLGSLDAEGYLTVSGRIKELIIRDGEKVMPREVEDVLEQHAGVLDAAVIGEPDGPRGEAVVAFVTPARQPPTAEELRAFCRGRLAEFKVPRRFVIAADLPRGPTGKILKRLLKEGKPARAGVD